MRKRVICIPNNWQPQQLKYLYFRISEVGWKIYNKMENLETKCMDCFVEGCTEDGVREDQPITRLAPLWSDTHKCVTGFKQIKPETNVKYFCKVPSNGK